MNAPKLCPPPPVQVTVNVSAARLPEKRRWISLPKMVPTVRLVEETAIDTSAAFPLASAFSSFCSSTLSSTVFSSAKWYTSAGLKQTPFAGADGWARMRLMSTKAARLAGIFSLSLSKSVRPTSSATLRTPSRAMISRSSCAMKRMKFSTYSGFPGKRARSLSFCVATPNGHVSFWHTRIMRQPIATSGAVAKPNSSAPSIQAIATSRPLISLPSVSSTTRLRSPF